VAALLVFDPAGLWFPFPLDLLLCTAFFDIETAAFESVFGGTPMYLCLNRIATRKRYLRTLDEGAFQGIANVGEMARIDAKGDVDDQRAKSRPHVLLVWFCLLPRLAHLPPFNVGDVCMPTELATLQCTRFRIEPCFVLIPRHGQRSSMSSPNDESFTRHTNHSRQLPRF